jgi:hypothetical protein
MLPRPARYDSELYLSTYGNEGLAGGRPYGTTSSVPARPARRAANPARLHPGFMLLD